MCFWKKRKVKQIDSSVWLIALGGNENILSIEAKGSRLSLQLKDKEKMDKVTLTNLGVKSIIEMSNKIVLVLPNDANKVVSEINKKSA